MTKVGLFIPCYVDQFFPQVGIATVELLEKLKIEVEFPAEQTCCGQPMANTGCAADTRPVARKFVEIFKNYEYVVCPSGSCTSMVRNHYAEFFTGTPEAAAYEHVRSSTFELCEFLVDVLQVEGFTGSFPHKVGVHQSCHGLRELRLGSCSERVVEPFNKVNQLLQTLDDIEIVELSRKDECCGFGGTFAVNEEAVSCMMGKDRLADHLQAGSEIITGADMSCLMHMGGLISREKMPLKVMHVVEILAQMTALSHQPLGSK